MDESIKVPLGFRFNPFEEELISLYLKPKVLGQKLPCNVVEERQLYGPNANPWQVFDPENHSWILSEVTPGKFEKVTYVFVNLTKQAAVERKKKVGRDNYIKKAGCGTWGGKTSRNEIRDRNNGDLIGEKRMLVFEINEDSYQDLSKVGYWKMHEFHLCGVNENISNPGNIVLCKITFDCSKNPAMKACPKINVDHPVKSSSKPQKKDTNLDSMSEAITTQTGCDDLVVSDSDRDKAEGGYCGTEIIEVSDEVECINSSFFEENTLVIASSPSEQLDTGNPKLLFSDFCWPAYDYKKLIKEEQTVEDTTTNLGKTKLRVETSCTMTNKLKPVSSDFYWPAKHDNDYQKSKKIAGGRGDLHFGMTKVQFSSYRKPKEEQSVEDTTTNLGKRKLKVETSCPMAKKLCPLILIVD